MNYDDITTPWGALFDLDGVLVDSEGIYSDFWHQIDLRFPTGIERFEYVIKGNTLGNILNTYFPDNSVRDEILTALKHQEENMEFRLFDGVEDFLTRLHRLPHVRTAIVTSSNVTKMEHLFTQLPSLRLHIDVVITEDDVNRSKPDPQGYNIAAQRLGVSPQRCIVFEDSMAGVEAGRRAGGAVIGIATTNPAERLKEFCDITVDTIADVDVETLMKLLV